MNTTLLPFFGALATTVAAFLAAVIALVNMLNAKDQKTTEFRQAWINTLRSQVSEFCAQARWISAAVENAKEFDPNCFSRDSKAYDSYAENRERINLAYYSICLHFKPHDSDFEALDVRMKEVLKMLARPGRLEFSPVVTSVDKLIGESRRILKKEWTRVKSGEVTYRITKYAAIAIIALSLVAGVFVFTKLPKALSSAGAVSLGAIVSPSEKLSAPGPVTTPGTRPAAAPDSNTRP